MQFLFFYLYFFSVHYSKIAKENSTIQLSFAIVSASKQFPTADNIIMPF